MKPIMPRSPWIWLLSATLTLSACGGGNSTAGPAPNTGNIPNLATRPSSQATQVKTTRLAGEVFDAFSRQPLEKAEIQLQIVTVHPTGSSSSAPPIAPASPTSTTSSTGQPGLPPNTQPAPVTQVTPDPTTQPTVPPFAPGQMPPGPPMDGPPIPPPSPDQQDVLPGEPLPPHGEQPALDGPSLSPGNEALPQSMTWSAQGASAASFQLAQISPTASPTPDPNAPNLFKTNTNNRGKFFINEVPEGSYVLTVIAPGYRTLTLTNINPNQLNIPLTPLDNKDNVDVVGMVMSPADVPVADALVSSSFLLGEAIGVPANSNEMGEFKLFSVAPGRRSLLALTFDEQDVIKQMGLIKDLPINLKNMKVQAQALEPDKKTTPQPSPSADSAKRKALEESVENLLREEEAGEHSDVDAEPSMQTDQKTETAEPTAEDDNALMPFTDPVYGPAQEPIELAEPELETVTEEQEEAKPSRGFNLLDSMRELITGEPAGESSDEKVYPVISLRSVMNDLELAGGVDLAEGYQLKQLEVFLTLPEPKEGIAEEIYMLSKTFPLTPAQTAAAKPTETEVPASNNDNKPQRFRLRLPELDKGHSYHLQLTAVHSSGAISYHHLYNLKESTDDLSASFLKTPEKIELEGEDVNAIPPVPGMAWSAVEGAELYHVTLARGSGLNRQVFWEAWTQDTEMVYPLNSREHRLKEQETYTFSVEAIKGLRPARNSSQEKFALPAYGAIWTDLSRLTYPPFEVVE